VSDSSRRSIGIIALSAVALHACGVDVRPVTSGSGSTSAGTSASGGGAGASATGGAGAAGGAGSGGGLASSSSGSGTCSATATCSLQIYDCGDGLDNDLDGLVDSADPECLGPCDNTENSLHKGIVDRQSIGCFVDCQFDSNGGPGDDQCFWSHRCDPHEVPPAYYPEPDNGEACAYDPAANISGTDLGCADLYVGQSAACHGACDALTPSGCDCFGCCELPAGSGSYVWISSVDDGLGTCDLASVGDATRCHPCEPVPSCFDPCDPCELCIGKGAVSPGCGVEDQCPAGTQPCGLPDQACCAAGEYCVSGCCQPVL
jgi:hypothetical protein